MKKIVLPLLLITAIISVSFVYYERDKKLIYWGQRDLTWADFKGSAPSRTPYVATTFSSIVLEISGSGSEINLVIETAFFPKQSWKKKNVTDHVLKHEQGHFDITEIYSRILRKTLQETKFKKYETISTEVQKIFMNTSNACEDFQDQYDSETDHSKKTEIQLNWNGKITSMLDSLSAWSVPTFTLDVGYLLE